MRVGLIAPTRMLSECCITDIHYCLPRMVVESETYKKFYHEKLTIGDTVIMDIRAPGWRREPEDFNIVEEALKYIIPTIIILPSSMFNMVDTIAFAKSYIYQFKPQYVAACLEGSDAEAIEMCKRAYKKMGIKVFAIPEHVYPFYLGEEIPLPKIYIENRNRIEELEGQDGILVTSRPIRLGLEGRLLSDPHPGPPSLTFREEPKYMNVVTRNIEETLAYYGGE